MEWFWQIIEKANNSIIVSAMQSFQPIDWIFLFAMLWGLGQGARKGFSEMFGKLTGLFFVSVLTFHFYKRGAAIVLSNIAGLPEKVAEAFTFIILTVVLGLSVSWFITVLGKAFRVEAQGLLKTVGGMVLGGVRMMLLISFIAQIFLFLPIDAIQQSFKPGKSYAGYTIARLLPDLCTVVMIPFSRPGIKDALASPKPGV